MDSSCLVLHSLTLYIIQLLYFKTHLFRKIHCNNPLTFTKVCWTPVALSLTIFLQVWAAASEAKHQPPADFLWKEQNKFKTSPNCTTILCKPNGEVSVQLLTTGFKRMDSSPYGPPLLLAHSIIFPSLKAWIESSLTVLTHQANLQHPLPSAKVPKSGLLFSKNNFDIPYF